MTVWQGGTRQVESRWVFIGAVRIGGIRRVTTSDAARLYRQVARCHAEGADGFAEQEEIAILRAQGAGGVW